MPTFPSITPAYGVGKQSNPNTKTDQYGDGYSSRLVFGLNQNLKRYTVRWQNITETVSDTIETFLDARGAAESFDWTPPNESSGKFVCQSWVKTIPYNNRATINATFQQVAEP